MKFWQAFKCCFREVDPENDWSKIPTEELIGILKRDKSTGAILGIHAGNRIVAELLDRMHKRIEDKK